MVTLELTDTEVENLAILLGLHSLTSDYRTYSVFDKLLTAIDPDLTDTRFSPSVFTDLATRTSLERGLLKIRRK